MNKIFWTPAGNGSQPNIMIIDDVMSSYSETEEQTKAMGKLIEVRTWPCLPVITEQRKQKFSKSFHVAIEECKGVTIRSFFMSEDGKERPYTYFSDNVNLADAYNDLKRYAQLVNSQLNDNDFGVLLKEQDSFKPKEQDRARESLKQVGGGFERIWQHIRRH